MPLKRKCYISPFVVLRKCCSWQEVTLRCPSGYVLSYYKSSDLDGETKLSFVSGDLLHRANGILVHFIFQLFKTVGINGFYICINVVQPRILSILKNLFIPPGCHTVDCYWQLILPCRLMNRGSHLCGAFDSVSKFYIRYHPSSSWIVDVSACLRFLPLLRLVWVSYEGKEK